MKLLLDACVWPGAVSELARHGHDVVWVGDWPTEPGDDEILTFAVKEKRIVVTLDKDFGELAVAFGHVHSGIIRIVNFQISKHASVCLSAIEQHGEKLTKGEIITASREDYACDRRKPMQLRTSRTPHSHSIVPGGFEVMS